MSPQTYPNVKILILYVIYSPYKFGFISVNRLEILSIHQFRHGLISLYIVRQKEEKQLPYIIILFEKKKKKKSFHLTLIPFDSEFEESIWHKVKSVYDIYILPFQMVTLIEIDYGDSNKKITFFILSIVMCFLGEISSRMNWDFLIFPNIT